MTGLAGYVLVHALCHRLLDLGMAVLAGRPALDVAHASGTGLVAIDACHLLLHVNVFGKPRGLRKFLAQIAVAAPPLHGACVADEGAPAVARAVLRRWGSAEGMTSPFDRRRVVTVEASRVAEIAGFLFRNRLLMGKWLAELLGDLLRVIEGELVAFSPADRQGICERRPSIIRAMAVVPDPHGSLTKVRAHDAGVELRHLVRMTGEFAAGLFGDGRVVAEGDGIAVMPHQRTDIIVKFTLCITRQHCA